MRSTLDELDLELTLTDTANREIVGTYTSAENQEREAVYATVELRHPSLATILDTLRSGENPLDSLDNTKAQIAQVDKAKGMVSMLEVTLSPAERIASKNEIEALKKVLSELDNVCGLYEKFESLSKDFYFQLIKKAKDIAEVEGIAPTEVVRNRRFRDAIYQQIFPTREESERFISIRQRTTSNILDMVRGMMDLVTLVTKETPEEAKQIPKPEALKAMHDALNQYEAREHDRIYA